MSTIVNERWATGLHVGDIRPNQVIEIRRGHFTRRYDTWAGADVDAIIPGESERKPWQAFWTPTSSWTSLPNCLESSIEQDFDQNGLAVATVTIENVLYRQQTGVFDQLYHLIDRGALAPWRGYRATGRPVAGYTKNEWYDQLTHHSQIRVWQGYGDALDPVFTGLIESVDPTSTPDELVLTVRDFGGPCLIDQYNFGYNNGPRVPDPVVFVSKGALKGDAVPVGYSTKSSGHRDGHPGRFVLDTDPNTSWLSLNRQNREDTEWLQVRVPRGKYQSILLNPHYKGHEVYLGVYAHNNGLGGEPCKLDDEEIPNGWVNLGLGTVPGDVDGGWPYVKRWGTVADRLQELKLGMTLNLGDNSIVRIGFSRLAKVPADYFDTSDGRIPAPEHFAFRAGVDRFQPVKRKLPPTMKRRKVGKSAKASSVRQADDRSNYVASNVLDTKNRTHWASQNRHAPDLTEWVQIHLPAGTYGSFRMFVEHSGYDVYAGIYAHPRLKKPAKVTSKNEAGTAAVVTGEYVPSQVDGVDLPSLYQWVDLGALGKSGGGVMPGDTYGGWKTVASWENVSKPLTAENFDLGHQFNLGEGSILRIGLRNLHPEDGGVYRAAIKGLHGLTKTGVKQPKKPTTTPEIEVGDLSDIVRVVLRWAGFKEWDVEDTGVNLDASDAKKLTVNANQNFMDTINLVAQATGFVFFMQPPTESDLSIGIPTFRQGRVLKTLTDVPVVRDSDLLTGIDAHITEEPLSHIIRIRGAASKRGKQLGSDHTRRFMSGYRPPWARSGRLAHVLKHFIHTEPKLKSQLEVDIFARLVALQEAMQSATATIEIPGTPAFGLDDHIALVDGGTGFNTRLYVAQRTSVFHTGPQTSWKTSLGGSLIDTPDFTETRADLLALLPKGQANSVDLTGMFLLLASDG